MCGIFGVISKNKNKDEDLFIQKDQLNLESNKIQKRGPDDNQFVMLPSTPNFQVALGFHRLAINDLSSDGNQPMYLNNCYLICNGEIYNFKQLCDQHQFEYKSKSDCEIILHMYLKLGMEDTIKQLDGYFAFILVDQQKDIVYVGRDPFGVRPLFLGRDKVLQQYFLASELKSIHQLAKNVDQFPPGSYLEISGDQENLVSYYHCNKFLTTQFHQNEEQICQQINQLFTHAVKKRLMSDRPIGCLLSGGLDSSLVSALVAREFKKNKTGTINTFSIGMTGSTDLYFAQKVADHIGSIHHHIELTPDDFLKAIPEVIYHIESYDTTTVRASVGNYLVGKYIKEKTDCVVIYNGDGSDEQSGYLYLRKAPSVEEFQAECVNLLTEIHMFDVLRSDRSISSNWSLESRTPFLDIDFVNYYMSIDPQLKMYGPDRMEKYLLRKAFSGENLLPNEVLWRPKEAFSDGCSSPENSWHTIIQKFVDPLVSRQDLLDAPKKYPHNTPVLKESYYYRKIFESYYPNRELVIKHFWLPKWCGNQADPSARALDVYTEQQKQKK